MKKLALLFCCTFLLFAATATGACGHLSIYNETGISLNENTLCQAAEALYKEHGIQTVIYLHGEEFPNKDAWFSHLDKIETRLTTADGLAVRNSSGYYYDLVLVLEANVGSGFAAIAYGALVEELMSASGWSAQSAQLEQSISNKADLTDAFETTIASLNDQMEAPANVGAIFGYLLVGLFLVVLIAVVIGIVRSSNRKKKALAEMALARRKRVEALWLATSNLVTTADALLGGNTTQDSELYRLWVLYYGDKQAQLHLEVTKLINTAQQVYKKAFDAYERLAGQYSSGIEKITDANLKLLEVLYITLRGTTPLSSDEIKALLDPVQLPDEPEPQQSQLLSQINEVLQKLNNDSIYNATVESIGTNAANAEGVLGYISTVKQHISALAMAINKLMPMRQRVERDLDIFAREAVGMPGADAHIIHNYLHQALKQAGALMTNHQYFESQEWLEAIVTLIAPTYWGSLITQTKQNLAQAEAIHQIGVNR